MKYLVLATFFILNLSGCDSPTQPAHDVGPDVTDHVDANDVVDVVDADVVDAVDAPEDTGYPDGWPAPSCDEDPHQIAVATTGSTNYKAFYPNLFIPQADYAIDRTEVFSFNVETMESRILFTLEGEYLTEMVIDAESQTIWLSAQERWNYQNPGDRAPPRILRWDLVTETLEDLTPQLPPLRSEVCDANYGNLYLQMLDLERNRILLYCEFTVGTKIQGDVYFLDMTSGEKTFLGRHEDQYYRGFSHFPEPFHRSYYYAYCSPWIGNTYNGNWNGCYWQVDQSLPQLVYESSDGDRLNSSTAQADSDGRVLQVWKVDDEYISTATSLETGEVETLPVLPVYPQGLAPTGKHFPHLTTWVEGYDPVAIGNTLQASQLGHVFIWDLQTNVYRQVTCLNDVGAYRGGITMMPGDPTGRYGLVNSVIGDTKIIHLKDLRAAGIMSADGHLLPPPEK